MGALPGSTVIAQPTPQRGAEPDPGICRQLVAFLEQHRNLPQDSTPVTLAEAMHFAREDNRYACRSGIYGLHKDGITLPEPNRCSMRSASRQIEARDLPS